MCVVYKLLNVFVLIEKNVRNTEQSSYLCENIFCSFVRHLDVVLYISHTTKPMKKNEMLKL